MRRQSIAVFDFSQECAYIRWLKIFTTPQMSVNDLKSAMHNDFSE